MRGWIRMMLIAAVVAAASAACARADGIAAPDADAARDEGGTTQSDSTGRWGGHLGSGG